MNKMFVTSYDTLDLSGLDRSAIEPNPLLEEGLFTEGNLLVRGDGTPYRGHYHVHRSGQYMAGFSHDPNDAASQTTFPTPTDTDWHMLLYKGDRHRRQSIVPSPAFYDHILESAITPLTEIILNSGGENYILTSATGEQGGDTYRNLSGLSFYLYDVETQISPTSPTPEVRSAADSAIVAYFKTHYYHVLNDRAQRALDSTSPVTTKIAALAANYTIAPPLFKNTLLYQEGDFYKAYDFNIVNVIKRNNFLKVNLDLGQTFVDSGTPQIVYSFLQTDEERKKYFEVRNIAEFNEEFVKTDFYRSVVGAKEGRFSPRENIVNKTISQSSVELLLYEASTMSAPIDLLMALIYNDNIFVFYSSVCNPRTYPYPTADLINTSPLVPPQEPPRPLNATIDNISNLYCSYTSEISASAFFGINIQNLIQHAVLFPGAFSAKDANLYMSQPILLQKTISDKNRFITCNVPRGNLGEYTGAKSIALHQINIEGSSRKEEAIMYYGAPVVLEKNKKYRFTFQTTLNDHSVEVAKRMRRKISSMIEMIYSTFNSPVDRGTATGTSQQSALAGGNIYTPAAPEDTQFQLKFLIDLIFKLKKLYQNTPERISYLDKVLTSNYALTYETAELVRKILQDVIEDINVKVSPSDGKRRVQITRMTLPPLQHVATIEKDFSKMVSADERRHVLTLPRKNAAALPMGAMRDISDSSYTDVYRDMSVTAETIKEKDIPRLSSFSKEYIYSDILVKTSLEKYAPNYKLTACSQTFGVKYSTADLRDIAYNAETNLLYLEILSHHSTLRNNTHIQNNLANNLLVTSPTFVPLTEYYDAEKETYSLEAGNYLIKMSNSNYSYNNYFLLVI